MKADRDVIIVGAGAAGLTAAQYAARANLDALLLEELAPGGQCLIIDNLENYPGFPDPLTGIDENDPPLPEQLILMQNYPNPFNAETRIKFLLPHSGDISLAV